MTNPIAPTATNPERIRTILLATDFSDNAGAALDWAIELAKAHHAHIAIVHAVETELPALAVPPGPIAQKVQASLNDVQQKVAIGQVSISSEYHIDKPWKVVPAVAAKIGADLIVLGARGKTNFAGKLLGSTADRIIRTTSAPVIVIRDEVPRPTAIKSVLIASDFSEESVRATSMAIRLIPPSDDNARVVLLHVIPLQLPFLDPSLPHNQPVPEYWDEIEKNAKGLLKSFASHIQTDGLNVEAKTVRGNPAKEILRQAKSIDAQLIAIGTQGRTGLNRFFMGSVAEWVLHHAQCPVLTVRKPDPADPISISAMT